jgi:hypothetical protein
MKEQRRGRGPSCVAVAIFPDGDRNDPRAPRPFGVAESEVLIGGRATFSGSQRRWGTVALAVMAAIAFLGLGGRWTGLSGSALEADRLAALGRAPGHDPGAQPTAALASAQFTELVVASPGKSSIKLPVGFAIVDSSRATDGTRRAVVVGYVAGRQAVAIRLLDADGVMLSARSIAGGASKTARTLWSFQVPFEVPSHPRVGGPDGYEIEVRWIDAASIATICTVPATASPIPSRRCVAFDAVPSQPEPSGRLRRTIP